MKSPQNKKKFQKTIDGVGDIVSSRKSLGAPPDTRQKTKGHKVVDERSEGVVEWVVWKKG